MPYQGRLERYTAAQQRHRSVFASVAALGSLGVIGLMTRGASTSIVVVWMSLVILGYAYVLSRSPLQHVSDRQKGDACYHLGFILGLVVLIVCLWQYDPRWGDVRPVLLGFSAAVASVAWGFTLKVLFQQFREDPDEIDAQVRGALADAAREVHGHTIGIVQDLSMLRAALSAEIARPTGNVFTTLAHHTQVALEQLLMAHVEAVRAISRRQHERAQDITAPDEPSDVSWQSLAERLSTMADDIRALIRKHTLG